MLCPVLAPPAPLNALGFNLTGVGPEDPTGALSPLLQAFYALPHALCALPFSFSLVPKACPVE